MGLTKKDVELAAKVPECSEKINNIRKRLLELTQKEEERRLAWSQEYYATQGEIRAAEQELQAAAEADARCCREAPIELRMALESAQVAIRGCGEAIGRARTESMAAEALYQKRVEQAKRPGAEDITKAQIEQFLDQITLRKGALKEQESIKLGHEARAAKLKAEIDKLVAAARKAAR